MSSTGCQSALESNTDFLLFATTLSLAPPLTIFQSFSLHTLHLDNSALPQVLSLFVSHPCKMNHFGHISFLFTGPTRWNSLPYGVRLSQFVTFVQVGLKSIPLQICFTTKLLRLVLPLSTSLAAPPPTLFLCPPSLPVPCLYPSVFLAPPPPQLLQFARNGSASVRGLCWCSNGWFLFVCACH